MFLSPILAVLPFLVMPYLLVHLTDPVENVRRGSVQASRTVLTACNSVSNVESARLLKKILKNEDEIAADVEYAAMVSNFYIHC
jgi:hypothetical protein